METSVKVGVSMTMPSDREIRLEWVLNAPLEKVWRAYTEPELLRRWWARGNPMDIEHLDVKTGGRWRFIENAPDGREGFEGYFREVVPQKRLVQTFGWDSGPGYVSLETVEFEPLADGRTKMVDVSRFFTTEDRDQMLAYGMQEGFEQSLAALDKVLESL